MTTATTFTVLGLVLGLLGTAAAWVALRMAKGPAREARRTATVDEFMAVRQYYKEHIRLLIGKSLEVQRSLCADPSLPVLTRPGWILERPVRLSEVLLTHIGSSASTSTDEAVRVLRTYWPLRANGGRMETYHEAVEFYDRPDSWFNGASYRLLEVIPTAGTLQMTFADDWYWDMIDTTEALLYEAAITFMRSGGKAIHGTYRRFLADPFDLTRRCAIPGIDAITIRLDGGRGTFYVHRRDAARVASAQNGIGIVPAGEFQPSDDSWAAKVADFDLWRSVMREYVEEFLDFEDARIRMGTPIDYAGEPPYSLLNAPYSSGIIKSYLFGVGLDPVTWKPTIFTAFVFPAKLFDKLFAKMVSDNREGLLELPVRKKAAGKPFQGWPFDEEAVFAYANDLGTLPVARAGLMLAWRHRNMLGITH